MFKILIADDEKFIRKGIISILQRNLEEPVKCIEASNGIDALQKAEQETPDLIITDINMPGRDGLEFVKELKEKNVTTTVIILSGYENFEYAKRAITLGIKEYVMKPIKKAEFIDLIKQYIADIRQHQQNSKEEIVRKIEQQKMIEGIKKDFLVGLLKCTSNSEAHQYLQQLKELNLNFAPQLCTCVVFQYEVSEDNREYMDFMVKNILDEYLSLESDEFILNVSDDVGQLISIFRSSTAKTGNEERKKLIRQAARLIREYGKVRVFAGIGDVAPDFEHLGVVLGHALEAADYKLFDRGDIVCAYDEIEQNSVPVKLSDETRQSSKEKRTFQSAWAELNRIYSCGQSPEVLSALRREYQAVCSYIESRSMISGGAKSPCKGFSACWSLDELKQELKSGLESLGEQPERAVHSNQTFARQVLRYVDDHITDELDLNVVASQFNRTPGYISTMFKQYVEGGFTSYVTGKRIELACRLLKDVSIPIQEVAGACGFVNAKYFSVVFKKQTGCTPREYREGKRK